MRVTVVGAGVVGLTAALELCERGAEVTVVERAAHLGESACSWCAGGRVRTSHAESHNRARLFILHLQRADMLYKLLLFTHLASVIVWLGGMAFALFCLRPAAMSLPPAQRIALMQQAMGKFFSIVNVAIILILVSGVGMIATSGVAKLPIAWMTMIATGAVMMGIFWHLRAAPFRRLLRAAAAEDWPVAGAQLNTIRRMVSINLVLGVVIVAVMKTLQ